MGKIYDELDERLIEFIEAQQIFFVASAPAGPEGHVNLSPKGLDALRVLDGHTVAYQDLAGSGAETIAHVRQNGRLTIMFCAFAGPPRILRLYGRGEVLESAHADFGELAGRFLERSNTRSIIRLEVTLIADSCGMGVPLFDYLEERDQLPRWAERKGPDGITAFMQKHNASSIDGLPTLESLESGALRAPED